MAEILVLAIVAIGIYGRRNRRRSFEWSRESLRKGLAGLVARATDIMGRVSGRLPGILGQCAGDVRDLVDDTLGLLDPGARRRIRGRAREVMSRRELAASGTGTPSTLAHAGGPGTSRARQALQRRYMEGSISLERYMEESERLSPDGR